VIAALVLEPLELWWARRLRPEWRRTPLVAVHDNRVAHATPEARREGVTPGMSLSGARLRCEGLQVTEVSEAELQAAWESVMRELYGLSPFLDGSSRGRAFLSISASEARMLAEAYDAPVGHASGCEVAELAALATSSGRCRVLPAGGEEAFLGLLPLRFLRGTGLSGYSLERLRWLGLSVAGELAGWRRGQLRAFLGAEADRLLPYLHGPWRERLRVAQPPEALRRTIRFAEPLFEPGPLEAALARLAESLEETLAGRSSGRLTVAAEVGGVESRATRFAKKPLRGAREIALLAGLALADTGAAPVGIEALTLELPEPARLASQGRLWPARERREQAWEVLLERFPRAAVEVEWLDPYAESADLAWRWRHPAGGVTAASETTAASARSSLESAGPSAAPVEVRGETVAAVRPRDARERQARTGELVLG
jgi:protein ImuB